MGDIDTNAPDPLLATSEGDEAAKFAHPGLSSKGQQSLEETPGAAVPPQRKNARWLGLAAAGVGVGSAAIAAAALFWGDKRRAPAKPRAAAQKRPRRTRAATRKNAKTAKSPASGQP